MTRSRLSPLSITASLFLSALTADSTAQYSPASRLNMALLGFWPTSTACVSIKRLVRTSCKRNSIFQCRAYEHSFSADEPFSVGCQCQIYQFQTSTAERDACEKVITRCLRLQKEDSERYMTRENKLRGTITVISINGALIWQLPGPSSCTEYRVIRGIPAHNIDMPARCHTI
jgi:hypothetical protein